MTTAKIFWSGNSQAIRLPSKMRFPKDVEEVEMSRKGDQIIISPVRPCTFGKDFLEILGTMPDFERPRQTKTRRLPLFP